MSISKKQHAKIIEARKYINMGALFRDGKPLYRDLTPYKIKKINKAMKDLIGYAGSEYYLKRDFVSLRKTKRLQRYNDMIGVPRWAAGVMISGGEKVNRDVVIGKNLELAYKRGEGDIFKLREGVALDARTEKTLIKSIKKYSKKIMENDFTMLAVNGNYIGRKYIKESAEELIIEKALYLYNKYEGMAQRGEKRSNGRLAASMKKWGIQLLWEN